MNIHKSQLFWCELQGYYWFWPIPISGILFEGSDSCWTAQIQPPLERPRSTTDSAWSLPRWSTGRRLDGLEVLNSFWGFDMGNQKAILELWVWLEASLQFSGLYIYNIFILLVMPHFFCRWRLFLVDSTSTNFDSVFVVQVSHLCAPMWGAFGPSRKYKEPPASPPPTMPQVNGGRLAGL